MRNRMFEKRDYRLHTGIQKHNQVPIQDLINQAKLKDRCYKNSVHLQQIDRTLLKMKNKGRFGLAVMLFNTGVVITSALRSFKREKNE